MEGIADTVAAATAKVISESLQRSITNTAQGFALAAAGTPGLTKALWPQGSTDSQAKQEASLDDMINQANSQIGVTLNNGLGVLMTDPWSFDTFGAHGLYSDQVQLSVPQQTDALSLALDTLLAGESLMQNNWFANVSPPPQASVTDCIAQGAGIYSCSNDGFFLSADTGKLYALRHKGKGGQGSLNVLQQIASNGWADLNTLFDGAYNCTASGKSRTRSNADCHMIANIFK